MKKLMSVLLVCCLIMSGLAVFAACNKEEVEVAKAYSPNDAIIADPSSYIDYAANIDLNTEKYPSLADMGMGLFYVSGFNERGRAQYVDPETDDGAAVFDVNKPTVVITHGVQMDGGYSGAGEYCSTSSDYKAELLDPDSPYTWTGVYDNIADVLDESTDTIDMKYIYWKQGYNVAVFNYHNFSDSKKTELSGIGNFTLGFGPVEQNVLAGYGAFAMIKQSDGSVITTDNDALNGYSISQYFAAEYVRAMSKISNYDKSQDVIFMAHSMGGFILPLASQLLTELVKAEQLDAAFLPDRICLQDPYMGIGLCAADENATVSWTGKKYIDGSSRHVWLACLENLVIGYDIAVEMYVLTSRAVAFFLIIEVRTDEDGLVSLEPYADSGYYMVNQLTAYSEVCPDYTKNGEQHMYGHNGIREYYMLTKAQAAQTVACGDSTVYVPSAALTTEQLKGVRGYSYIMDGYTEGYATTANVGGKNTMYIEDNTYLVKNNDFSSYQLKYGTYVDVA